MLGSASNSQVLIRLSQIRLTLKLKFDCKIRLLAELGTQSQKHPEEPSLYNNLAVFNQTLEVVHRNGVGSEKQIVVNVFVISSRNKYKAGICKVELKDLLGRGDEREGRVEIERKLEQCPDREAEIKMVVEYEMVQRTRDGEKGEGNWNIQTTEEDKCNSVMSVHDLARLTDFTEDLRKSHNIESTTERKNYPIRESIQLLESNAQHRTDRADREMMIRKVSDMVDIPPSKPSYDSPNDWVLNRLKRVSYTPKIQSTVSLELKKTVDNRMLKQRISMEANSKSSLPDLSTENKILKSQAYAMKESMKQLSHQIEIKDIEIIEGQKRVRSLKDQLQAQTTKSRAMENELREASHKYKESKSENKEKTLALQATQRRTELKLTQYKEQIQKLSTKMVKFQNQNQTLLFEVNQLKDELLIKEIDHNNYTKAVQFQALKSTRSTTLLNSKIEELEAQIQLLNSKNEVLRLGKEQLEQDIDIREKVNTTKDKEIAGLRWECQSVQEREGVANRNLLGKSTLILNIIKRLEEMTIKNDEMKVVQYSNISESEIISILETISKFMKDESFKIQELLNQLSLRDQTIGRMELELAQMRDLVKKNTEEAQSLSNLYEETKFRLEVQITNVEVLEQELFNSKADLECEKQNRKDSVLNQQRMYQLQSENEQLLAHLHQIQRQKMEYYNILESQGWYSRVDKDNHHRYKDSRTSNFSDQQQIRNFISQLHFPATEPFWQSSEILQSPIKTHKEVSIISEEINEIYKQTQF